MRNRTEVVTRSSGYLKMKTGLGELWIGHILLTAGIVVIPIFQKTLCNVSVGLYIPQASIKTGFSFLLCLGFFF